MNGCVCVGGGVLHERTIKSKGSLQHKVLVGVLIRSSERLFRAEMCLRGTLEETVFLLRNKTAQVTDERKEVKDLAT